MAQWTERQPVKQRVTSSIPSQAQAWVTGRKLGAYKRWPVNGSLPLFLAPIPSL